MKITASELRADVYNLLDRILQTGEPILVERKGRLIQIDVVVPQKKLDRLVARPDFIVGDPDALIELDWSDAWRP